MDSETSSNLSVFCTALFGLITVAPASPAVAALGGAGALLALPAVVARLRGSRDGPERIVSDLRKMIEREWRGWVAATGEYTEAQTNAAFAALNAALPRLNPDPQIIMQANRDHERIADIVLESTQVVAPHDYAERLAGGSTNPDAAQAEINGTVLRAVLVAALDALSGNEANETALGPWFQREVLERTAELATELAEVREMVGELTRNLRLTQTEKEATAVALVEVRTDLTSTRSLVAGFLETMVGRSIPPDQFPATLFRIAAEWKSAGERLNALDLSRNLSPQVVELRERAKAAYAAEQIAEVEGLLAEMERVEQKSLDGLLAHEAEIGEEIRLRRKGLADTKNTQAAIAASRLRYAEAARLIAEAVDLSLESPPARFEALRGRQDAYYVEGRDGGVNASLAVSIEIAKLTLERAANADQRGSALNDLGNSLNILGARESGTARLEEAVAAFRDALKEHTRRRVPLEWAMTQNNLGNVLRIVGERENSTKNLEEAIVAHREALKEYTHKRMPLQWAMTQNNLGNALSAIGERESGTTRLEEAVAAYRNALQERTHEHAPLEWAMTENNLGAALSTLGERESGTTRLEEAVAAYRNALQERTRERVPLYWAMTQNNLGATLTIIGMRNNAVAQLEEAITAYRNALQEWTRERAPFDWATTQNNLGAALEALAECDGDINWRKEAVAIFRDVLDEFTRERAPVQWAATQHNLGAALHELGEHEGNIDRLKEAVAAYREALKERTRERGPLAWAMSIGNQGGALMQIADKERDLSRAEQALDQLTIAAKTCDAGNHAPYARFFEARRNEAAQLIARLRDEGSRHL